jgi:hypothetical protein
MKKAIIPIIKIGETILTEHKLIVEFTTNKKWDDLLNDLDNYSHLFILAYIGDK